MATISYNHIAEAIYEALKGKNPTEQQKVMKSVVEYLARKKLLAKKDTILMRLRKITDAEDEMITARVVTKRPLSEAGKNELKESLARRYKVKGARLEESIDDRMIGGVRIEINDEVIDLTAKNKIRQLQEHLTKNQ